MSRALAVTRTLNVHWPDLGQEGRAFVFDVCRSGEAAVRRAALMTANHIRVCRLGTACAAWFGARGYLSGEPEFWRTATIHARRPVLEQLMVMARGLSAAALEAPESEDAGRWAWQSAAIVAAVEVLHAA